MLISTPQMAQCHSLEEQKLPIPCDNTPLKRITCTKLLGVYVDQHLTWKKHVDHVLFSSYGTLSVLCRLKNLAPFHMRKHLTESLVLSKLSYACCVSPFPTFLMHVLDLSQEASQVWRTFKAELA